MENKITITCVSENTVLSHSLIAQHGQSLHINYFGNQYIFDIAEIYEGWEYNMRQLNFNITEQKSVILSHRHLDHMGSFPKLLAQLTQSLYIPDDMEKLEEKRYSPIYREIDSTTKSLEEVISSILSYPKKIIVTESIQIEDGLYTTGSLGDSIKEQSLVIDIPRKGLVILVGCAHPTIPVIIEKAKLITKKDQVYGLIGGFHYKDMGKEELQKNIDYLASLNTAFIVPSHCTGFQAIRVMQDRLGKIVQVSGTGQFGVGNSISILPDLIFNLA